MKLILNKIINKIIQAMITRNMIKPKPLTEIELLSPMLRSKQQLDSARGAAKSLQFPNSPK